MASTGGGKTSDEIVYELADSILAKIPEKLDPDKAYPELLETNEKGQLNSLSTVLLQEIDRFNRLLKVIKVSSPRGNIHKYIHCRVALLLWLSCNNCIYLCTYTCCRIH